MILRATAAPPVRPLRPARDVRREPALVESWADQVAAWISDGKTPYVFMHAPDDTFAPENAYDFHAMLRARTDVGELPKRPGAPRQQSLF